MLKLPVGIDNFEKLRKENFYYVDKTRLIEQLLEQWGEVNLFTRPRRFGKTLNMSMLQHFFEIGADKTLFDGLYISERQDLCEKYMGKFPVIFLSLKGVDGLTFDSARYQFTELVGIEADKTTRNEIEKLIAGEAIEKVVRMELTYDEIDNSIENLWSILFTTGYLTQAGRVERGVYRLVIPNREVREVYILQIREWFRQKILHDVEPVKALLWAFEQGEAEVIEGHLNRILSNTISIFDTKARNEEKENFYHGILLGLLRCEPDWLIQSNIESGDGLVDILIESEDPNAGIIIELKYAQTYDGLEKACEKVMNQIWEKRYDERLRNEERNDILAYGIAFCKKKCKVIVERSEGINGEVTS